MSGPRSEENPTSNSQTDCAHCPYTEHEVPLHEAAVFYAIFLEIRHDNLHHSKHGWQSHVRERCRQNNVVTPSETRHERRKRALQSEMALFKSCHGNLRCTERLGNVALEQQRPSQSFQIKVRPTTAKLSMLRRKKVPTIFPAVVFM